MLARSLHACLGSASRSPWVSKGDGLCTQVGLTTAIVHLMQGDVDGLVDDAVSLGFLPVCVERKGVVWFGLFCVVVVVVVCVLRRGEVLYMGGMVWCCLTYSPP